MFIDDIINQIPEVIQSLSKGAGKFPGVSVPECVFRIQNVADYMYTDKKISFTFSDVFSYMLPFSTTLFEFRIPAFRFVGSKKLELSDYIQSRKCGVLCQNYQFDDDLETFYTSFFIIIDYGTYKRPAWLTWTIIKCNKDGTYIDSSVRSDLNPITKQKLKDDLRIQPFINQEKDLDLIQDNLVSEYISNINGQILPVILTCLNFLHCKNVITVSEKISKKFMKSREKKNKPYFGKFYTLAIEPAKNILKTVGNSDKTGITKAFHICRGHLRRYDGESKLFGKHENKLIWIPNHTRGTANKGIVSKDYTFDKFDGKNISPR